jgi:hypothetical protein
MFDKKEFIDDFRYYYHKNKHDEYDLSLILDEYFRNYLIHPDNYSKREEIVKLYGTKEELNEYYQEYDDEYMIEIISTILFKMFYDEIMTTIDEDD